jgi:hypothetical protein
MLRIVLFSIALISFSIVKGQSFDRSYLHHDVLISYGLPSTDLFHNIGSSMLDDKYPDKRYIRDNYSGSGIISLTYRKVSKSEWFFWGASVGYNSTKGDIYNVGSLEGELKRSFITVGVEGQYRYQNFKKIQLYSGVGLGFSLGNETLTPPPDSGNSSSSGSINRLAYQINVIGIRLGKDVGGFIELGYGYKGIVNAGLSVQIY